MDGMNFSSDKEQLLQTLARYDGNVTVEDVVDSSKSKFHARHYHTLFLHVLLENVCVIVEPDEGKRRLLFDEVCKRLSASKFLNSSLDLSNLMTLRRKLAQQFLNFIQQLQNQVVPDPTRRIMTVDSFLEDNDDFSVKVKLDHKYERSFEELSVIAEGGFGTVCKAKCKFTGIIYAVKKIVFKYKSDAVYSKVIREAKTIGSLNHPNIVSYNSAWIEYLPPLDGSQSDDSSSASGSGTSSSEDSDTDRNEEEIFEVFSSLADQENEFDMSVKRTVMERSSTVLKENYSFNEVNKSFSTLSTSSDFQSDSCNASETESDDSQKIHNCTLERNCAWDPSHMNVKIMLCIQMEYCDCDLRLWLDNRAKGKDLPFHMDEIEIFKHILDGVMYIHSKGIIHRDLKPQNIFFSKNNNTLKIGDFGLATLTNYTSSDGNSIISSNLSANLGTFPYAAPEQRQQKSYNSKVDMYSLGIILIELLNNFHTRMELSIAIEKILKGEFPAEMENKWSKYIHFLKNLVKKSPKDRFSAKELLNQLRIHENSESNEIVKLKITLVEKDKEIESLRAQIEELRNIINQQKMELAQL